jgi:hypothetical protein
VSDTATFAARYEQLSDGELLRLAAERETLTAEAVLAIDAELARRGFSVAAAKQQTRRAERKATRCAIGNLGFSARGWGKHFLGVSNYHLAANAVTEEFDSTLWLWVMWLPIVPLASYHIERHERGRSLWWSFSKQPFSASNEAPPFFLHVILGWAFSVIAAVAAFRILNLIFLLALH